MELRAHNLRFFWIPGTEVPVAGQMAVSTEDLEALEALESEVSMLERVKDELREVAQTATGAIHALPRIEGAPEFIERPTITHEANMRYVAWNVFAVVGDEAHLLSTKMQNLHGGVLWVEMIKGASDKVQVLPPQENIDKGYRCETCRRFNHENGQAWLNQVTHRFDKAESAMWLDVLETIEQNEDVEVPESNRDFGLCLEDSKLVLRDYPGCAKYKPRTMTANRYANTQLGSVNRYTDTQLGQDRPTNAEKESMGKNALAGDELLGSR